MILEKCREGMTRTDCVMYAPREESFLTHGRERIGAGMCEHSKRLDGLCPYLVECECCGAELEIAPEIYDEGEILTCPRCSSEPGPDDLEDPEDFTLVSK